MADVRIEVSAFDLPEFRSFLERVRDFITEYAWHDRGCAATDADGEWHRGKPACTCGYDEALAALVPPSDDRPDLRLA